MDTLGLRSLFLAAILCLGSLISCNTRGERAGDVSPELEERVEEKSTQQDTVRIVLNSNDKMQFDKDEITVRKAQVVILTLKHTGTMPKSAMGHNFVLIDNDISISQYAKLAMDAKDFDYIPQNHRSTIAYTDLIGGGASSTITFKAPEIGNYDFLCSFPGHYSIMKGKFIVK